ncbi:MAG: glycoside hydrolase family 11 protein [Ruminococcus sp.]|uniref:glycoside hydrolase family 11 protein n=1 Tax=Ruminococcus sp. TaxID=41978 RepID=UPI0025F4C43F|nr:glycoside hydrolase family 11 protein [Ruminococcus sp.]MBR5683792.1 glycoside hydrolase family 11 protein [Ruminococcus sp.]
MKNKIRHFLSLVTACIVTTASLALLPADAVGNIFVPEAAGEQNVGIATGEDSFAEHYEEPRSDADFELWKAAGDDGKLSFDINRKNMTFSCSWEGTDIADFEVGSHNEANLEDFKRYYIDYTASAETEGGYVFRARFVGVFKQVGLAEIFVEESYSGMKLPGEEFRTGTIAVNGAEYDVYRIPTENGSADIVYIIRRESVDLSEETSGKIDIKGICEELDIKKVMGTRLCVRALGEKGSVKVSRNRIVSIDAPPRMTVPNCEKENKYVYYDGLRYSFWQIDDYSNGEMTVYSDGKAACVYNNNSEYSNCLFRKGCVNENILNAPNALKCTDYDKINIRYRTDIKAKDGYAAGVYGWTYDQTAEFYVVQFRNSDDFVSEKEYIDTVEIDGVKYDLYKGYAVSMSFDSPPVYQYWSVSQVQFSDAVYGAAGEVDLLKHFKAWEKAGARLGKLYETVSFAEVFGKGAGEIILEDVDIDIESPDDNENVLLGGDGNVSYKRDGYDYSAQYGGAQSVLKKDGTIVFDYDGEKLAYDYISKIKMIDKDKKIYLDKKDNVCIGYAADVSTEGNYYITGHAWMKQAGYYRDIHLQVFDSTSIAYVPSDAKKIGETRINDKWYDLYVQMKHILPHTINGDNVVDEYYSVCRENDKNHSGVSGYIDFAAHAAAFKKAGYKLGCVSQAAVGIDMTGRGKGTVSLRFSNIEVSEAEPETFTEEDVELFRSFLLGEECDFGDRDFDINSDGTWDIYDLMELRKAVSAEKTE